MWPYFARRFGLVVAGHLEPKPGVPPTTKHLAELIALMKSEDVQGGAGVGLLRSAPRALRRRRDRREGAGDGEPGGARPGTESYVGFVDYNVRQVAEALRA